MQGTGAAGFPELRSLKCPGSGARLSRPTTRGVRRAIEFSQNGRGPEDICFCRFPPDSGTLGQGPERCRSGRRPPGSGGHSSFRTSSRVRSALEFSGFLQPPKTCASDPRRILGERGSKDRRNHDNIIANSSKMSASVSEMCVKIQNRFIPLTLPITDKTQANTTDTATRR